MMEILEENLIYNLIKVFSRYFKKITILILKGGKVFCFFYLSMESVYNFNKVLGVKHVLGCLE